MTIRPATPADLPEIARLIQELAVYEELAHEIEWSSADDLADALFGASPAAHVLMADAADGVVAGFALWFTTYSTFVGRSGIWLEDLFVRPAHRGAGHGKALLQALMTMTDGRLEWAVLDWNEPSIAFYRSLGAEPVDGWTRYRWTPHAAAGADAIESP